MKRMLALLMCMPLMLCGCGQDTSKQNTVNNDGTHPEDDVLCVLVANTQDYSDIRSFADSDACAALQNEGHTVCVPVWDETKYQFRHASYDPDQEFCIFYFDEIGTDHGASCRISYDSDEASVAEISSEPLGRYGAGVTQAVKDGVTHDVYIGVNGSEQGYKYSYTYFPYDECRVTVSTESYTHAEILGDFHDFDIVPVSEWNTVA